MVKIMMIGAKAIVTSINEPILPLVGKRAFKNLVKISVSGATEGSYGGISDLMSIMMVMVKIGPIEAIPTKPKESFFAFLPPLTVATPAPKAKINGTVADPVVTPPLSKINGKSVLFCGSKEIRTTSMKQMK